MDQPVGLPLHRLRQAHKCNWKRNIAVAKQGFKPETIPILAECSINWATWLSIMSFLPFCYFNYLKFKTMGRFHPWLKLLVNFTPGSDKRKRIKCRTFYGLSKPSLVHHIYNILGHFSVDIRHILNVIIPTSKYSDLVINPYIIQQQ